MIFQPLVFMFIFAVILIALGIAAGALIPSVSDVNDYNVFGLLYHLHVAVSSNWT